MGNLLATGSWGLDVAFFVILLLGTLLGVMRGFVKFVCKIAGTVFSVIVAVMFCVSFQNTLEIWFGMTTALAGAIGSGTIAKYLAIAISFVILAILIRLAAWGIGKLGTALVEKYQPIRIVNRVLGGILGLFSGFMLIMLLLAICSWIPVDSMHQFIEESAVVGRVYDWVVSELGKVSYQNGTLIAMIAAPKFII